MKHTQDNCCYNHEKAFNTSIQIPVYNVDDFFCPPVSAMLSDS